MNMRRHLIPLWITALLLGAGCASSPSGPAAPRTGSGGTDATSAPATAGAHSDPQPGAGSAQPPTAADASGTLAGSSGSAAGPGQTSDERRAVIDKRLSDSLGSFDAELRQQQQQVAQERDARKSAAAADAAANAAAAAAAIGDKSGDAAGSATPEGPPGDADRAGRRGGPSTRRHDPSGDLKSEKAAKAPDDNAGNGATAREIPDGSDDDVVARRLRQAAERETDPELKEKLWQEYLDYKKNAQGK